MKKTEDWVASPTSRARQPITEKDNPEDVKLRNFKRYGRSIAYGIRWEGGIYDSDNCWIKAESDSVVSLYAMV